MPKYSREQIRQRRRIALGVVALVLVLLVAGCASLIRSLTAGPDVAVREADPAAMTIDSTPLDAPALSELPADVTLTEGEAMGIDVSTHQGDVDWAGVAADGYSFAYIKATEGSGYTDPKFAANWDGATANGVTRGAYHYFTLCSPGKDQAEDFLKAVPVDDSALPPALDLEFDGACDARPEAEHTEAEIEDFLQIVEAAWGRRVVIYSSSQWREHYGLPQADGRPNWYFSDAGRPFGDDWAVWQLHFEGNVSGIKGDTDIDVVRIETLREHSLMTDDDRQMLEESIRRSDEDE